MPLNPNPTIVCPCTPQMMFRVKDLEASKQYYTEALGMKLLRESENEKVRLYQLLLFHRLHHISQRCG